MKLRHPKALILTQQYVGVVFIFVLLTVSVVSISGFAQTAFEQEQRKGVEKLFTERSFDCDDIYKNCSRLIVGYYDKKEFDSIAIIIKYWESECYGSRALVRLQTLLSLQSGSLPSDVPSDLLLRTVLYYKWYYQYGNTLERQYRREHPEQFDKLIDSLAAMALDKNEPNTAQNQVTLALCGKPDSLFHMLQLEPASHTPLGEAYRTYAYSIRLLSEEYFTVFSGAWIPVGNRDVLGVMPMFGFITGYKSHRYIAELYLGAAIGKSSDPYLVKAGGNFIETDDFGALLLSLDGGYEIWRNNHHEFDFLVGLGIQTVNAIYKDDEKYPDGKQFWSMAGTLGTRYRWYPVKYNSTFMYIQPTLEFSAINTEGGTNLSGATVTIRIGLGFKSPSDNSRKSESLRLLEYEYR